MMLGYFLRHHIHTIATTNILRSCLEVHESNDALGHMHAIKEATRSGGLLDRVLIGLYAQNSDSIRMYNRLVRATRKGQSEGGQ